MSMNKTKNCRGCGRVIAVEGTSHYDMIPDNPIGFCCSDGREIQFKSSPQPNLTGGIVVGLLAHSMGMGAISSGIVGGIASHLLK